jgi:hypothetical protein
LDDLPFLTPLQLIAFWGVLRASTVAYSIKVLDFGYQSIDMHCIVLPLKFDGGLFISVLRNKQLFKKMDAKSSHFLIFKPRHLKKGHTLEKSHFLDVLFLVNGMGNPTLNLTSIYKCFLSIG